MATTSEVVQIILAVVMVGAGAAFVFKLLFVGLDITIDEENDEE